MPNVLPEVISTFDGALQQLAAVRSLLGKQHSLDLEHIDHERKCLRSAVNVVDVSSIDLIDAAESWNQKTGFESSSEVNGSMRSLSDMHKARSDTISANSSMESSGQFRVLSERYDPMGARTKKITPIGSNVVRTIPSQGEKVYLSYGHSLSGIREEDSQRASEKIVPEKKGIHFSDSSDKKDEVDVEERSFDGDVPAETYGSANSERLRSAEKEIRTTGLGARGSAHSSAGDRSCPLSPRFEETAFLFPSVASVGEFCEEFVHSHSDKRSRLSRDRSSFDSESSVEWVDRRTMDEPSKTSIQGAGTNIFHVRQVWSQCISLARIPIEDVLETNGQKLIGRRDKSGSMSKIVVEKLPALPVPGSLVLQSLVIHPFSKIRLLWVLCSLMFLSYDGIMVPISTCFDLKDVQFTSLINLFACCFWTIDIILNFFTGLSHEGKIETDLVIIARTYVRSWLVLDVSIVTSDWIIICLEGIGGSSPLRIFRNLRFLRVMRLLRLFRFVRVIEYQPILQEIVIQTADGLHVTMLAFKATGYLLISVHLLACAWHLVGSSLDNGWVRANQLDNKTVFDRYWISIFWMAGLLHSTYSSLKIETNSELIFCSWFMFSFVVVLAFYTGIITHTIFLDASSDVSKLKVNAYRFVKRHGIGRVTYHRMLKFLSSKAVKGTRELLLAEDRLLQALPKALQEDLQYESRVNMSREFQFLTQVNQLVPRIVRVLCSEAMFDLLSVEDELVFAKDDVCHQMFFVRQGNFMYTQDLTVLPRMQALYQPETNKECLKGYYLSEAVLWTQWNHCGNLVASQDSLCLTLNATKFGTVITQSYWICVCAVKYARAFVQDLNTQPYVTDLCVFERNLHELDDNVITSEDTHFIFISHYKQEAGTEAALMKSALETLISHDPGHAARDLPIPVFVDSEDLTDLSLLKNHVMKSESLVVLLTNGFLTRPWCLLEIVTAFLHEVRMVPVEIQRPGVHYTYPDDEFYRKLRNGQVIDQHGAHMLKKEGVTLKQVENAIRCLFMKIALPFSPHKSETIRNAELIDIVSRSSKSTDRSRLLVSNSHHDLSQVEAGIGSLSLSNIGNPTASARVTGFMMPQNSLMQSATSREAPAFSRLRSKTP